LFFLHSSTLSRRFASKASQRGAGGPTFPQKAPRGRCASAAPRGRGGSPRDRWTHPPGREGGAGTTNERGPTSGSRKSSRLRNVVGGRCALRQCPMRSPISVRHRRTAEAGRGPDGGREGANCRFHGGRALPRKLKNKKAKETPKANLSWGPRHPGPGGQPPRISATEKKKRGGGRNPRLADLWPTGKPTKELLAGLLEGQRRFLSHPRFKAYYLGSKEYANWRGWRAV